MSNLQYRRYHQERRKKPSGFIAFLKLVALLVCAALLISSMVKVFGKIKEDRRNEVTLNSLYEDVDVRPWGSDEFEKTAAVQILLEGDEVRTGEGSYATLGFQNGTQIYLDESTQLVLSEFKVEGEDDQILLNLVKGRVFTDQIAKENGNMQITVATDLVDVISVAGKALTLNNGEEGVYVFQGPVSARFLDRGPQDVVIEERTLGDYKKSIFDSAKALAFLDREDVNLLEAFEPTEFEEDDFLAWAMGEVDRPSRGVDEEVIEEAEPEEEEKEEQGEEEAPAVKIQILSPSSPLSLEKDGIALEGKVLSGEVTRITVAWSGDGTAYELSMYEPGSDSFRYVADLAYGNLVVGENVYTVIAYDAEGNASTPIRVVVNK